MKIIIFISFLILSLNIYCDDNTSLNRALEKISHNQQAFKYEAETTQYYKERERVTGIIYNPANEDPYKLVHINGNPPTDDDIKKYREQRKKNNNTDPLDYLGKSFTLINQENSVYQYSFTSKKNVIPGVPSKVPGYIWIDIESDEVLRIDIYIDEKKTFFPGIYVKRMQISFVFKKFNNERTVLDHMNIYVEGQLFKRKILQNVKSKLYNYELIN